MEVAIEYAALLIGAVFLALVVLFSIGFFSRGKRPDQDDRFVPGTYDGHDHGHRDGGHGDGGGHGH